MEIEKPLVNKDYLLFKTEGKGVWTFVEIPEISMLGTSFGMLKVKGKIDDYEFSNVHLMLIGSGHLGLAVKSEIRKKIKKEAPDAVHVTIYEDRTPLIILKELLLCMEYEDGAVEKFEAYTDVDKCSESWHSQLRHKAGQDSKRYFDRTSTIIAIDILVIQSVCPTKGRTDLL